MKCFAVFAALALAATMAAAPVAANRALKQNWALLGMQEQCLPDADVAGTGALDNDGCKTCMESIDVTSYPQNSWACTKELCQKPDLFPDPTTGNAEEVCVSCLQKGTSQNDLKICKQCLELIPFAYSALGSDETVPVAAAAADPLKVAMARMMCDMAAREDQPGFQGSHSFDQWLWATAICHNLPLGSEMFNFCLGCINSTYAQVFPLGYATEDDAAGGDWPRLNEFGKCADYANSTYWAANGATPVTGVFASCGIEEFGLPGFAAGVQPLLPVGECVECMRAADLKENNPGNASKAYACHATCRNPNYIPDTTDTAELAALCVDCVTNGTVYDAHGCTLCFKVLSEKPGFPDLAGGNDDVIDSCLQCVKTDPYNGTVGNYQWGCGECAAAFLPNRPADYAFCEDCIKARATAAAFAPDDLLNATWVGETYELVCQCIDMAKESTLLDGPFADAFPALAWYTEDCPNCTAQQKQCFRRRNITLSSTPEGDTFVVLPFGYDSYEQDVAIPPNYRVLTCNESAAYAADLAAVLDGGVCGVAGGVILADGTADCTTDAGAVECIILTNLPGWKLLHLRDEIDVDVDAGYRVDYACAVCTADVAGGPTPLQAYACEEYCMNTYTIHSSDEHELCTECVLGASGVAGSAWTNFELASPQFCDACMKAVNPEDFEVIVVANQSEILEKRLDCIGCSRFVTEFAGSEGFDLPTAAWACTECAKIEAPAHQGACYQCLSPGVSATGALSNLEGGVLDPSDCVEGAKDGWLLANLTGCSGPNFAPVGTIELLDNGTLVGGVVTVVESSVDACAKVAQLNEASFFTFSDVDTTLCWWVQGNYDYLQQVGVFEGGDCGVGMPFYETNVAPTVESF